MLTYLPQLHLFEWRSIVTAKQKQRPGPDGPGPLSEPLQSLGTQASPRPDQTESGNRRVNVTPLNLNALDSRTFGGVLKCPEQRVYGTQPSHGATTVVMADPETSDANAGLIGTLSWVGDSDMRIEVDLVRAECPGPRRELVRLMLVEALSASAPLDVADFDVGAAAGTGVRVPVVRPQAPLAGAAALPLPCPEAKEVSALASA